MFNWHLDSGRGNANSLRAMWFHLQISCGLTAANGAALLGKWGGGCLRLQSVLYKGLTPLLSGDPAFPKISCLSCISSLFTLPSLRILFNLPKEELLFIPNIFKSNPI